MVLVFCNAASASGVPFMEYSLTFILLLSLCSVALASGVS